MPVFELNRSQGIILSKISIFGQKINFELDITPKWKLFSKFGLHKLFFYHQNFQFFYVENLKSARFLAKLLARHHFEENILFGQKWILNWILRQNDFFFSKFGLHKLFFYHQKFQIFFCWKFKKCPFLS